MGLARLYWKIHHRILILYEFIYRKIYLIYFSNKIKNIVKNKEQETFYFIYDMSISPIAYGELFDSLMFSRSLQMAGKKIFFVFTKDEIRSDYKYIHKNKNLLKSRLKDLLILSENLLKKENIIFRKKNCAFFTDEKNNVSDKVLFLNALRNKVPLYKFARNLTFIVYKNLNRKSQNNFLLKKNSFKIKPIIKKKFKNYFCLGIRMAFFNEKNRNITIDETQDFIKKIRLKNKKKKIIIVSDLAGYNILKKNTKLLKDKNLILSKKYLTNYTDDGSIILNSKKYFQFKGTGISTFAEYSKTPYEIFHNTNDYTIFSDILRSDLYYDYKNKIKNIWQTKNQSFIDLS